MLKVICLALLVAFTLGHLSCELYEKSYLVVDDWITKNPDSIAAIVRLAFHDCVGHSCDGCLNFKDPHNNGLDFFTSQIDEIYDKEFKHHLSRSDFWQLAAHVALIRGGLNRKCDKEHCTFFDLQFWWGRKDCPTSPHHENVDDAGSAHGDYHEVWRVLHGDFGLNHKEVVAILGAHSLGGAHKGASGFDYNWQRDHLVFDNYYFKNMISLPYTVEDVSKEVEEGETADPDAPPRHEFAFIPEDKEVAPLVMLNCDMSLWKHIKSVKKDGEYTGEVKCFVSDSETKIHQYVSLPEEEVDLVSDCPDAKTAPYVYQFAHHLDKFYDVFSDAWWKMVSNGYKDLKLPGTHKADCGYCIPQGGYCVDGFEKAGKCCPGSKCSKNNKCI